MVEVGEELKPLWVGGAVDSGFLPFSRVVGVGGVWVGKGRLRVSALEREGEVFRRVGGG